MIASTLYVRVVPQDRGRDYVLLAGYEPGVVMKTAAQYTTLNSPTRDSVNAAIERMKNVLSAKDVKDVTAPAIQKQLAKLFGEVATKPAPAATFANMGIGNYLPKV